MLRYMTAFQTRPRELSRLVLDAVLPPQCLACGKVVDTVHALCPDCWAAMSFIAEPMCACCGMPFEFDPGPGALCGACLRKPPPFARARAVFDDASRSLVLGFKHADRTEAAPAFGRWMARAGSGLLADADLIAPVPLHWTRLFWRRYNQAALLAKVLGEVSGVPVVPDLLARRKRTPSLGHMGPPARRRVLAGAFAVRPARKPLMAGKRVLLVDDVLTSGITVAKCARLLTRAGAQAVDVLTLARVVRPAPFS